LEAARDKLRPNATARAARLSAGGRSLGRGHLAAARYRGNQIEGQPDRGAKVEATAGSDWPSLIWLLSTLALGLDGPRAGGRADLAGEEEEQRTRGRGRGR